MQESSSNAPLKGNVNTIETDIPLDTAESCKRKYNSLREAQKLHKLNDDIPGEVISRKLYVLEDLLKQMFSRVREHPEQMDRMHKLMYYYLPTMLKLVRASALPFVT